MNKIILLFSLISLDAALESTQMQWDIDNELISIHLSSALNNRPQYETLGNN